MTRYEKMGRKLKILILLSVGFTVWAVLAPYLAERLIVEKPLNEADAILVLGGSSVYLERTEKAARLFEQGIAPKILLTDDGERAGWSAARETNPPFVELAQENLVAQGVPPDAVEILSPRVAGTIDEAEVLAGQVRNADLRSLLIVTSAYHTRRAYWIFDKVFRDNEVRAEIGIVPAAAGQQTPPSAIWWLSPRGWQLVAGEYVKTLYYWLFY